MKIRSDFVSNSSSSSFIIGKFNNGFISTFNLTKADFLEAIVDLWPKNQRLIDGNTFYILDKDCPNDLKIIMSNQIDYLKHWTNVMMVHYEETNEWYHSELNIKSYLQGYSALRDVYQLPYTYDFNNKNFIHKYNIVTHQCTTEPVSDFVDHVVRDMRAHYGVVNNYETLMSDYAKFLLHFDDNEIWELTGMSVPGRYEQKWTGDSDYTLKYNKQIDESEWTTGAQTVERVCEVFFKWFKEHGKLKSLEKRIDGVDWTWNDLFYDVMAATFT